MNSETYFDKTIENFREQLLATPILNQLTDLNNQQIQFLFSQIYYFVKAFPGYLGILLWKTNNKHIRFAITENLVDEHGGIDKINKKDFNMIHSRLLKNFIKSTNPTLSKLADKSIHTKILMSNFDRLFLNATLVEALGMMTAMESISVKWFSLLYHQLKKRGEYSNEALYFFELHMSLDEEHGSILKDILMPLLKNKQSIMLFQESVETISLVWKRFYYGIAEEIANEHCY